MFCLREVLELEHPAFVHEAPGRADVCYRGLTRLFGLDGNRSALWN